MNNSFENNDALISKLDFGQDSAESERGFLQKVFIPTSLFIRIKNGKKQLVLGRKGAGKTAVCLTLYENLNNQKERVSLVTPRDLSKFKMVTLNQGSINLSEASLLSWKYTLYVEISIYIMEAAYTQYGKNHLKWPDPAQQIRKFLADNIESKATWIDKTFKIASAIRKIGFKVFDVGVDLDTMPNDSAVLAEQIEDLTDVILNALELLIKDPIYILIDKVDDLWEPGAESESLLVGLLRATKELGEQITKVKVIVFLRSDIYDALKFHDSDKFHSLEERITWNKDELKKLVSLRSRGRISV